MNIRKADASDESPIIDFLNQFPPSDRMSSDLEAINSTFRRIIQNSERGSILIAKDNGDIVGTIALSFNTAMYGSGPYANIEDLIVAEQAGWKEVGGDLVRAAIDEAIKKGCHEIQVKNPSDLGYPAYLSCGLTSTGRNLRLKLKH